VSDYRRTRYVTTDLVECECSCCGKLFRRVWWRVLAGRQFCSLGCYRARRVLRAPQRKVDELKAMSLSELAANLSSDLDRRSGQHSLSSWERQVQASCRNGFGLYDPTEKRQQLHIEELSNNSIRLILAGSGAGQGPERHDRTSSNYRDSSVRRSP
jgi:hypothetical protein